ncbi:MAG: glycyl-radical enzyme activating protein [Oscillospiraceae bacterium]|nr:glycyl-radical enzyme activating protein [Oscillospiraceae bacterium]
MSEKVRKTGEITGSVFNIQRYSIHDGPGIRTTVFLKGCPIRCFWCQNPESQSLQPELLFDKHICTLCGECISACPSGANTRGEKSVLIDRKKCSGCGKCVDSCPPAARKPAGNHMTAEEVMSVVIKDKAMYKKSGGGITLSGGDFTMQPEFSLALLKMSREMGLHTAAETCGHAKWEILESLLGYTDYLFYDIKMMDPERHKKGTGHDNRLILDNAVKTARMPVEMHIRCPMIPGFNDTPENVAAVLHFVVNDLKLPKERFTLLRYNKYAEGKFERLDREEETPRFEPQSPEYMQELEAVIRDS